MFKTLSNVLNGTTRRKNETTRYSFTEAVDRVKATGIENRFSRAYCGSLALTVQRFVEVLLFESDIPEYISVGKDINAVKIRDLASLLGFRLSDSFAKNQEEITKQDGTYDQTIKAMLDDINSVTLALYSPSACADTIIKEWRQCVQEIENGEKSPEEWSLSFCHCVNTALGIDDGRLPNHVKRTFTVSLYVETYLNILGECLSQPNAADYIKW